MRGERHPDDGALLALVDARRSTGRGPDPDGPDADRGSLSVRKHVGGCVRCRERVERLHARSLRLAAVFAEDERLPIAPGERGGRDHSSVPPRGWTRTGMRAAAAAAVLLAVALTPAGAILARWVQDVLIGSDPHPTVVEAPTEIRFGVEARDFEIHVLGDARGARFVITVDRVQQGIATLTGAGPASELVLGDARLDVRAAGEAGAFYRITLPERVGRVTLYVGDRIVRPEWSPGPTAVPRTWTAVAND